VKAVGMKMRKLAWLGLLAAITLAPAVAPASSAKIRLFPDRVDIGAFFQGVGVTLQGEIPLGCEAVVEIQGAPGHEDLLRQGRRGGLWMTVGEIRVENVPNLYLVLSSAANLPQLDGQETPWGMPKLKSRVKFQGALSDRERDRFFQEFLELKKSFPANPICAAGRGDAPGSGPGDPAGGPGPAFLGRQEQRLGRRRGAVLCRPP